MTTGPGQRRDATIVGIYEYPLRKVEGITALEIKADSARRALDDAGLKWSDVDGLYDAGDGGPGGLGLAEYMGFEPSVIDTTAVAAARTSSRPPTRCGQSPTGSAKSRCSPTAPRPARTPARSVRAGRVGAGRPTPMGNMEDSWGMTLIANYAQVAQRHMYQYGTTTEQLAEISVATRAHAVRNPQAVKAMEDLGLCRHGRDHGR